MLPYFLAAAVRIFPAQPVAWKLWLFPFALALVLAARALAARVAPGLDVILTTLFVLSPAVLPAFNLMLDLPALALAWLAIAVFLAACDRRSPWLALGAGLLAGLAAQVKYPGGTALAVIVVCAAQRRFWRGGALAVLGGVALFMAWELFLLRSYGHTMFFHAVGQRATLLSKAPAAATLGTLCLLGALAPGVALLGLARSRGAAIFAAALQAGAFVVLQMPRSVLAVLAAALLPQRLNPETIAFLPSAAAVLLALIFGVRRAARGGELDRLLLAWGAIEVAAALAMTPFLASRRLLGLAGVATLLVGRGIATGLPRRRVAWCAAWSAVLGCFVFAIDWTAARETRRAVEQACTRLEKLGFDAERERVWFTGHWSFEYYAKRAGWRAVEPRSRLRPGDWLVEPRGISSQPIPLPRQVWTRQAHLEDRLQASPDDHSVLLRGSRPRRRLAEGAVPLEIKRLRRQAAVHAPRRPLAEHRAGHHPGDGEGLQPPLSQGSLAGEGARIPFVGPICAHLARPDQAKAAVDPGPAFPWTLPGECADTLEVSRAGPCGDDGLPAFLTFPATYLSIRQTSPPVRRGVDRRMAPSVHPVALGHAAAHGARALLRGDLADDGLGGEQQRRRSTPRSAARSGRPWSGR